MRQLSGRALMDRGIALGRALWDGGIALGRALWDGGIAERVRHYGIVG